MAPIRKSKDLNKLSFKENKRSPVKGAGNGDAKHKRKKSDKLGSEWKKKDLEDFYSAYRKYGKDWNMVAAKVGRTVEMVEALFELNKAYLSLPEGIGSVAGLIAMMTDYYKSVDSDVIGSGSGSESESIEEPKVSKMIQKHYRGKTRMGASKSPVGRVPHMLHSHPIASKHGCLLSLKSKCSNGKETRIVGKRTPRVPISPPYKDDIGKHISSSKRDTKSGEDIDTEEASQLELALTKVLQGESSSQTSSRRTERVRLSYVRGWGKIHAESEKVRSKLIDAAKIDRLCIRKTGDVDSIGDGENTVEILGKRKQLHKKSNLEDTSFDHLEACEMHSKKRRQLLSEDESSALDALTILAGPLPEMEPTALETGVNEDDNNTMTGEDNSKNVDLTHEAKRGAHQFTSRKKKRKGKSLSKKIRKDDYRSDSPLCKEQKTEALKKSYDKAKLENRTPSLLKQRQSVEPESVSTEEDPQKEGAHAPPKAHYPTVKQVNLPTKSLSKRKIRKMMVPNRTKAPVNIGNSQRSEHSASLHDKPQGLKEQLFHSLSSQAVQRWCEFEWFYSSIEYPWFANREFVAYLNHVSLGHIPKLTRVEWGVIRSSLGRARRFSQHFLREEKRKLEEYRESARAHYARLHTGTVDAIPSDLVQPLRVGQRVIARHPKIRGIHNGKILTVERNKCRVQFDRLELGVHLLEDIDCMDSNLLDNIPEAYRLGNIAVGKAQKNLKESLTAKMGSPIPNASLYSLPRPQNSSLKTEKGETLQDKASTCKNDTAHAVPQAQFCTLQQIRSREADIRALCDLSCALDKKEVLVSELRNMNNEYVRNRDVRDSELFKKHYASILLMVKETSDQVTSSVLHIRDRNTYEENLSREWINPPAVRTHIPAVQETGTNVVEVIESSRLKAQKLVDVATQVMSSLKQGEDAYTMIQEVLKLSDNSNMDHGMISDEKIEIPSSLITSCVATLLMIQSCADKQHPPGEAAEILEHAVKSLQPICPQNVPIYRDIQMCMGMVKNQILALIPT